MVRVGADAGVGEFGHVRLADEGRAGAAQAGHGAAVLRGGGGISQRPCAGAGGQPLHIEQVFDGDGQAGQGSLGPGSGGLGLGALWQQGRERVLAGRGLRPLQAALQPVAGVAVAAEQAGADAVQVRKHGVC